jgi:malate synthase
MNLDLQNFFRITQGNGCVNIIDYFEDTAIVRMMNGSLAQGVFPHVGV